MSKATLGIALLATVLHPLVADAVEAPQAGQATEGSSDSDPAEMVIGSRSKAPVGAAPTTATAPRALTMEDVSGPSTDELRIGRVHSRYSLNFFGDTSLSFGRPVAPDHFLSFVFGAQDLLLKGELGNHIVATTEIAMEPGASQIGVDIERFNVRWQSEHLFIEAGRSHTSFGYWNNAYHHGTWLQPSIDRPRWVAFEDSGGLLPVHWVGLDLGAKFKVRSATLNLFASVGNGRGHIVDDVRNAGDYQSLKALHVAAEFVGIHWPELRAGVSGIVDRIPGLPATGDVTRPALPPDQPIDELIGGAYVAYAGFPLVFIAESYWVIHRAKDQQSLTQQWNTYGGFALLGYAVGRFTPYVEFERVASSGPGVPDPFFVPVAGMRTSSFDTAEGIVGLRIDLSDWTALKAEYRNTRFFDTASTFQEGVLNWSWGF